MSVPFSIIPFPSSTPSVIAYLQVTESICFTFVIFAAESNSTFSCPEKFFLCKNKNQCLPRSYICDGEPDCYDSSDEDDCQGNYTTQ